MYTLCPLYTTIIHAYIDCSKLWYLDKLCTIM